MPKTNKNETERLAELFRLDFISNMKVPDSDILSDQFYRFTEPWRQEWNCGVQVPVENATKFTPYRRLDEIPQFVFVYFIALLTK